MISIALFNELTAVEQAATPPHLRGPNAVRIVETTKGAEPRHFVAKALEIIKALEHGEADRRMRATAALKAFALIDTAWAEAALLGDWSPSNTYDPLPDFIDLRHVATECFGRDSSSHRPTAKLLALLNDLVAGLRCLTVAQRMGVAA